MGRKGGMGNKGGTGKKERNGIEEGKIGKIFVYAVYTLSRNTAEGQVCLRHYP